MPTIIQKRFSIEDCNQNPSYIYIFGDNLIGKGKGGQAIIRDCRNTYGIPTKRLPSMDEDSFFNDEFDEYEAVKSAIEKLAVMKYSRKEVTFVFPTDGLGTGLAQMKTNDPNNKPDTPIMYIEESAANELKVQHEKA